jgi:hypothetical protein
MAEEEGISYASKPVQTDNMTSPMRIFWPNWLSSTVVSVLKRRICLPRPWRASSQSRSNALNQGLSSRRFVIIEKAAEVGLSQQFSGLTA